MKIRRILKRNYTVIEYPRSKRLVQKNVYDAVKQSIEPADIALAYFPTMAGMPPLAVMTEIMIALGMNKKVIAVGSRAVRKNLGRLFSDAFSRAFESPEDLMKAKSLA